MTNTENRMKGICFIPPLYDATIEEIKDQTRRIVKVPQKYKEILPRITALYSDEECKRIGELLFTDGKHISRDAAKPKYKVGDILYLKEPYKITHSHNIWYVNYKFDEQNIELPFSWGHKGLEKLCIQQEKSKSGWLNKLFMPAWCARRFIKITGVRTERLQDITAEDCFREGIKKIEGKVIGYPFGVSFNYSNGFANWTTPREAYADLIDRINGEGTWDSNPYVWVYDYKLTDKPEKL